MEQAEENDPVERLFQRTRRSLGDNVSRAKSVAGGEQDDGTPQKIKQEALAAQAGISRATLNNILGARNSKGGHLTVNPKLRDICGLAQALGVPPAFLLMRPEDWRRLAQATIELRNAPDEGMNKLKKLASPAQSNSDTPAHRAQAGLAVARLLKVDAGKPVPSGGPGEAPNRFAEETAARQARINRGILAATSIPPLEDHRGTDGYVMLLALCAMVGGLNIAE